MPRPSRVSPLWCGLNLPWRHQYRVARGFRGAAPWAMGWFHYGYGLSDMGLEAGETALGR